MTVTIRCEDAGYDPVLHRQHLEKNPPSSLGGRSGGTVRWQLSHCYPLPSPPVSGRHEIPAHSAFLFPTTYAGDVTSARHRASRKTPKTPGALPIGVGAHFLVHDVRVVTKAPDFFRYSLIRLSPRRISANCPLVLLRRSSHRPSDFRPANFSWPQSSPPLRRNLHPTKFHSKSNRPSSRVGITPLPSWAYCNAAACQHPPPVLLARQFACEKRPSGPLSPHPEATGPECVARANCFTPPFHLSDSRKRVAKTAIPPRPAWQQM